MKLVPAIALSFALLVPATAEPAAHWQNAAPASSGWIGGIASQVEA